MGSNPFDPTGNDSLSDYLGPDYQDLLDPTTSPWKPQVAVPVKDQEVPGVFEKYIKPPLDFLDRAISTPYGGVKTSIGLAAGAAQLDPFKYIGLPHDGQHTAGFLPVDVTSPYQILKQGAESVFPSLQDAEAEHPYVNAATDFAGEFGSQLGLDPVLHGMSALKSGASTIPDTVKALEESGVLAELSPEIRAGLAGDLAKLRREGTVFGKVIPDSVGSPAEAALGAAFIPGMAYGAVQAGKQAYNDYQDQGFSPEVFGNTLQAAGNTAFAGIGGYHLFHGLQALVQEGKISPQEANAVATNQQAGDVVVDPSTSQPAGQSMPSAFTPPAPLEPEAEIAQPVKTPEPVAATPQAAGPSNAVPAIPVDQGLPGVGLPGQRRFEVPAEPVADMVPPAEEYVPEQPAPQPEAPVPPPVDVEKAMREHMEATKGQLPEPQPGEFVREDKPTKASVTRTEIPPAEGKPEITPLDAEGKPLLPPPGEEKAPVQVSGLDELKAQKQKAYQEASKALDEKGRQSPEYQQAHKDWMRAEYDYNQEHAKARVEPKEPVTPLPAEGQDLKDFGKEKRPEIEAGLKNLADKKDVKGVYKYAADLGIEGFKSGKRRDGIVRTIESIHRHLGFGEGEESKVPGFTRTGGGYWEFNQEGAKLTVYPRRSQGGIPPVLESVKGEPGAVEAAARTALGRLSDHGQITGQVKIAINAAGGQELVKRLGDVLKPVIKDGKPDVYEAKKSGIITQTFEYTPEPKPVSQHTSSGAWLAPSSEAEKPVKQIQTSSLKGTTPATRQVEVLKTINRLREDHPGGSHLDIGDDALSRKGIKALEDAGLVKQGTTTEPGSIRLELTPTKGFSAMARNMKSPEEQDRVEGIVRDVSKYLRWRGEDVMGRVKNNLESGRPLFLGEPKLRDPNAGDVEYPLRRAVFEAYFRDSRNIDTDHQQVFQDFPSILESIEKAKTELGLDGELKPEYLGSGAYNAAYSLGPDHVIRLSSWNDMPYLEEPFMIKVLAHPANDDGFRIDVVPHVEFAYDPQAVRYQNPLGKSKEEFYSDYESLEASIMGARDQQGKKLYENADLYWHNVAYDKETGRLIVSDLGAVIPSARYRTGRWANLNEFDLGRRMARKTGSEEAPTYEFVNGYTSVRDSPAVVMDTGESKAIVETLADQPKLAAASRKVYEEIRQLVGGRSLFGGFTGSPKLHGLWSDGLVFLNPAAAWESAAIRGPEGATSEAIAQRLIRVMLHEAAHDVIPAHGDIFEQQLADIIEKVAPHYDRLINILTSEDLDDQTHTDLAKIATGYLDALKDEAGSTGTGKRRLAPIPDQPERSEAGPGGGEEAGVRPQEDVQDGSGGPAEPLGAGARPRQSASERVDPELQDAEKIKLAADQIIARAEARRIPDPKPLPDDIAGKLLRKPTNDDIIDYWEAKPGGGGKLAKAGIARSVDIARNFPRTELDAESRARIGPILEHLNKDYSRSTPLHWEEVSDAAKEIFKVKSPEEYLFFVKKRGYALRPEEDAAARMLGSTREKELLELSDQMAKDPSSQDTRQKWVKAQTDFQAAELAMAESGTNMARAMAFRRMVAQSLKPEETMLGRLRGSLRMLGVPKENIPEILAFYSAGDSEGFRNALRRSLDPGWVDKALEMWKAGLVSGPATKLANLTSNTIFRGLRDVENLVGVGIDAVLAKASGRARERTMGEAGFMWSMYGKIMSGEDGAFKQWSKGHGEMLRLQHITKPYAGSKMDIEYPGAISGKKGEFIRTPFKSLEVDDTFFKHLSAGLEAARRAYRRAAKGEGGEGEVGERAARIYSELMDIVRHGQESPHWNKPGYQGEFKAIEDQMLRDTFQNPLEKMGQAVMQFQRSNVGAQILLPFIKTPANIAKEALLRTPYGFWKTYRKIKSGELKGGAAADELAKPLVGSLIGMAAATAAAQGLLTGGGPQDPQKNSNLKETGWQPYSFHFGGQYVSYQRMEPISSLLGMAADFAEGVKEWDELTAGKVAQRIVGSVTENITNKTFLSGLEGFFTFWQDPLRYGETYLKQLEASLVPNIVASAAKAVDPSYRKTKLGLDPIINRIPFASETLPAQTSPTGEPRQRPGSAIERLASPFSRTEEKSGAAAVNHELDRVGYVPAATREYLTYNKRKVDLTPQEEEILSKARVQATQALLRVIKDPSYQRLPDTVDTTPFGYKGKTKRDILEQIYRKYETLALDKVKPEAIRRAAHPPTSA